jgi:hypothetical protein
MWRLLSVAAGTLVAGCISPRLDEADSARRFLILEEVGDDYRGLGRAGIVYCLCTGMRSQPDGAPVLEDASRNLMLILQQAMIPGSPSFVPCDRCRFEMSSRHAERGNQVRIVIETVSITGNLGKFIVTYERPDYRSVKTLLLRRESDGWKVAEYLRMTET